MDKSKDNFRFVTHSMGGAFAEGMIDYLKGEGWVVDQTVHISPYQAKQIKPNKNKVRGVGTYVIDAQVTNDPVTLNDDNPRSVTYGAISNADLRVRKKSRNGIMSAHTDLIDDSELWDSLIPNEKAKKAGENSGRVSWNNFIDAYNTWRQINPHITLTVK